MPSEHDINHHRNQLNLYRNNLQLALTQALTKGGELYLEPAVNSRIIEAREGIAYHKAVLRGWNVKVEDLPIDQPSSDTVLAPPERSGKPQWRTRSLVYALTLAIGIVFVGWKWINVQNDIVPEKSLLAEGAKTRVSAPSKAHPTYDPRESENAPGTSKSFDNLFASVSPSPETPLKIHEPVKGGNAIVVSSPESTMHTGVNTAIQPTALPKVLEETSTAVPIDRLVTGSAEHPDPTETASPVMPSMCGSISPNKAAFVDMFLDGDLDTEKRKVVRDQRIDVTVDGGYLRVMPKSEVVYKEPALFYRTKFQLKNFCAVIFVSNFTGDEGYVSVNFRHVQSEEIPYKYYSFWVSVLGEKRYYIQSAMKGRPWELVQNRDGLLPGVVQEVSTLSVRCYDRSCSFLVNGIKIADVDGGIDEDTGFISFQMKGNMSFDVSRIEIYEL